MSAFVVSGLIKRRVELAGDIEKPTKPCAALCKTWETSTPFLQFEPDFRVEAIKPKASGRRRIRRTGRDDPDSAQRVSPSRRTALQSRCGYRCSARKL
jgi:hypothetical protein